MPRVPLQIVDDEDGTVLTFDRIRANTNALIYNAPSLKMDVALAPEIVMKEFVTPHQVPIHTPIIRQGKYECLPAAVAMLIGHTLFNVKRVMGKHGWCNDDRGAGFRVEQATIRDFGGDLIWAGRSVLRELGTNVPDGTVDVSSLNVEGMGHAVTWRSGEIVDPNFGNRERRYWGAEWAPWTMGARGISVFIPQVLSESFHLEIKRLRREKRWPEIAQAIRELTE